MTKIAASVSMDVDMAQELKHLATERGQTFSALIIELIEAGRATEGGLFSSTDTETVEQALESRRAPDQDLESSKSQIGHSAAPAPAEQSSIPAPWFSDRDDLDELSYEARVLACIADEPRSAVEIADFLEMPVAPVMNLLDSALEARTISGRRVGGSWRFWRES